MLRISITNIKAPKGWQVMRTPGLIRRGLHGRRPKSTPYRLTLSMMAASCRVRTR